MTVAGRSKGFERLREPLKATMWATLSPVHQEELTRAVTVPWKV
jgi:hypothetical protein